MLLYVVLSCFVRFSLWLFLFVCLSVGLLAWFIDCLFACLLVLVAEFISPKSVHFQFYKGFYYPKKLNVHSLSY